LINFYIKEMGIIYHITSAEAWNLARQKGVYSAPSLETEGFIHCSNGGQVDGVLNRYYKGQNHLVKLTIDTNKLVAPLRYDLAPSINEEFPHIYGPINTEAVIDVQEIVQ